MDAVPALGVAVAGPHRVDEEGLVLEVGVDLLDLIPWLLTMSTCCSGTCLSRGDSAARAGADGAVAREAVRRQEGRGAPDGDLDEPEAADAQRLRCRGRGRRQEGRGAGPLEVIEHPVGVVQGAVGAADQPPKRATTASRSEAVAALRVHLPPKCGSCRAERRLMAPAAAEGAEVFDPAAREDILVAVGQVDLRQSWKGSRPDRPRRCPAGTGRRPGP